MYARRGEREKYTLGEIANTRSTQCNLINGRGKEELNWYTQIRHRIDMLC